MTLQIKSTDEVCCGSGERIPITEVRDFCRHLVSHHRESFAPEYLGEHFRLNKESAQAPMGDLVTKALSSWSITPLRNAN